MLLEKKNGKKLHQKENNGTIAMDQCVKDTLVNGLTIQVTNTQANVM